MRYFIFSRHRFGAHYKYACDSLEALENKIDGSDQVLDTRTGIVWNVLISDNNEIYREIVLPKTKE
jgi:hypothetical protein